MTQHNSAHPPEVLAEAERDSWDDSKEVKASLGEHMASQTGKDDGHLISKAGEVEGKGIITLQHLHITAVAKQGT